MILSNIYWKMWRGHPQIWGEGTLLGPFPEISDTTTTRL
jgi:hypothetical protein